MACTSPAPQRPSQRLSAPPQADSAQLALLELNQHLASTADHLLAEYVASQDEPFALYENNTWMHILTRGEDTPPHADETVTLHLRILDLAGHLLLDSEGTYRLGKNELPLGVEGVLSELPTPAQARLIVPWYAAYGMQGNEHIPPYENIIIEIQR